VKQKSRELNVFSMSFLDAITAGFGAVVLLFMLVSTNALVEPRAVVDNLEAEARRWELRVLTGQRNLVQLKEQLQSQLQQWTALLAVRENLTSEIQETQVRLATLAEDSDARRAAIESLRAELAKLSQQEKELATTAPPDDEGTSLRSFQGEGNRQYLTGLRMGGRRVAILVDTSTSMLDRTLVNILRRRNMSVEQQRRAPKWQQVVNTVDWLTTQIAPGTQVQIIGFSDRATWLLPDSEGKWVTMNNGGSTISIVPFGNCRSACRSTSSCSRWRAIPRPHPPIGCCRCGPAARCSRRRRTGREEETPRVRSLQHVVPRRDLLRLRRDHLVVHRVAHQRAGPPRANRAGPRRAHRAV
jgi:hypothetical protein